MTSGREGVEADAAALETIRRALDRTLFVEAGAGTGKTRALVDRFVALVLGRRPIERIAAMTFTEKAAAELRDRVREELERALRDDPTRTDAETALRSLDRAQISTIHSFAQLLLRSFAAETGVDPAFTVQDEVMSERRLQEQWRLYLARLALEPEANRIIDRVLSLGLTTPDLQKLAEELSARAELATLLEEQPPAPPPVDWPDTDEMRHQLDALPLASAASDDKLRQRVESLRWLVHSLAGEAGQREAVLAARVAVLHHKWKVGSAAAWGGREAVDLVRKTAEHISERLLETLAACRTEALADLVPLIVRFVREEARARGREGALTFDDLILRVRDLLRRSDGARRALRERFDALLIDEFQDTDPLQVDIALAFATDPETGRMEPGSLFLVGDPKQSIYRFRKADMAVYSRTLEAVTSQSGPPLALTMNKRSRQVILDWVNAVFERVIGGDGVPGVQPVYRAIHAVRASPLLGPGVGWMGAECGGTAREIRQMEARDVAGQCRAVLAERWQVQERDGVVREARYGDIAILIPARTVLTPLERALAEAGVPYRVEGGSLIYRTQEVRDLLNCLTAIDDPADEVAVAGALRSPAFACSDVDLMEHRASGGRFNYLGPGLDERGGPAADGLRALAAYHGERRETSLAALIERFVAERGLVETGILDQGDRNSFRRMRFVVEQARAFEAGGPESLRAFVHWMEHRAGQAILDNEGAGVDDDEDAVRILTIHGAKGLEFPIVCLAGLSSAARHQTPVYAADYATDQVAVSIGAKGRHCNFELGDVDGLSQLEGEHAEAEFARLLYVGATRARDHLVVSLYHSARAGQCAARRLIKAGAQELAGPLPEPVAAAGERPRPFADLSVEPPDVQTEGELAAQREALVRGALTIKYTSATALGEFKKDEPSDESEPWKRGRGGTDLGRAVHAAMQSLPLDADDALIEAFARAQAVAEAVPHRARDVARLVRWTLRESQAMQRARAAARALREVPFAMALDGTVLEGFVDLLVETPEGIEIVDWKTDQIPAEGVPERLRGYELQAGLYVLGIEAATGRRVTAVTYVFASAGVEVSPGDPAALREAARARLLAAG